MYHALVYQNGVWVSYGLHIKSPLWQSIYRALVEEFDRENVTYVAWQHDDPIGWGFAHGRDVEQRAREEVQLANRAQHLWNVGRLQDAGVDGRFKPSRGIKILRAA